MKKGVQPNHASRTEKVFLHGPHLSVSQQRVHALQEARVQHVRLVHDEGDLLVLAAGAAEDRTQVFVKVLAGVLAVDL